MVHFPRCLRWSAALLAAVVTAACGGSGGTLPEVRETRYGVVRGTDDSAASGTYAWKGVPYAKPPVGALRWQPPAEPSAWTGERSATQFGSACLQMGRIYGPGANNRFDDTIGQTLNTPLGSEDCLTLNIWRPATPQDKLPVLVFVHGGSAISGYTADPVYDGAALAKAANAIVVTVQYRLDVLGYLQLPALHSGSEPYTGNYALLDIVQALRFALPRDAIVHHCANEVTETGPRGAKRQAILVGMGVHPGFADLMVPEGRPVALHFVPREGAKTQEGLMVPDGLGPMPGDQAPKVAFRPPIAAFAHHAVKTARGQGRVGLKG